MRPAAPAWRAALLATAFYLAGALYALRVVLSAPAAVAALPVDLPPAFRQITAADQKLVIAVVSAHARALFHAPGTLLDSPQCHPLPHALMLGQHELGQGLLGLVPYALTGDPVATYNAVVVVSIVLAGLAMHALVLAHTGSAAAAFVAGSLFAFHPARLGDLFHLSAIANHWTVFTLLALHRFFRRPTWPAAALVAACSSLQTLESIYPLVPHAVLVAAVSLAGAWRHRAAWRGVLPKLAAAALVNALAVAVVLGPYLEFKRLWSSLTGRDQWLYVPGQFLPGGPAFAGTAALLLAVIALGARTRRDAVDPPPKWALLVAGLVLCWGASFPIAIPGIGVTVPSLFGLVGRIVPGFDAIRRGGAILTGWYLVTSALAGLGAAAVLRRAGAAATVVGVGLVAAALAETFVPGVARTSFGRTVTMERYVVRPPDAVLAGLGDLRPGAVLDLPFDFRLGRFYLMADFVLAGAYHRHRVAACYNSFLTPVQDDVAHYAGRVLDDPRAADALLLLGIRNVFLHRSLLMRTGIPPRVTSRRLVEIGRPGMDVLYAIDGEPGPATSDPAALALTLGSTAAVAPGGGTAIALEFRNPGSLVYRSPDPITPTSLVFRWYGAEGALLGERRIGVAYPAALVPGDAIRRDVPIAPGVPSGPVTRITVARVSAPDLVLAETGGAP